MSCQVTRRQDARRSRAVDASHPPLPPCGLTTVCQRPRSPRLSLHRRHRLTRVVSLNRCHRRRPVSPAPGPCQWRPVAEGCRSTLCHWLSIGLLDKSHRSIHIQSVWRSRSPSDLMYTAHPLHSTYRRWHHRCHLVSRAVYRAAEAVSSRVR